MTHERSFRVTNIGVKGKHKTPTITMESLDGEKLTLKLQERQHLDSFEIDQEFTMKLNKTPQNKLFPEKEPENPVEETEDSIPITLPPPGAEPE